MAYKWGVDPNHLQVGQLMLGVVQITETKRIGPLGSTYFFSEGEPGSLPGSNSPKWPFLAKKRFVYTVTPKKQKQVGT